MRGVNATALIVAVVLPVLFIGLFAINASRADSEILTGLISSDLGHSAEYAKSAVIAGEPMSVQAVRSASPGDIRLFDPKMPETRDARWDSLISADSSAETLSAGVPDQFAR